MRHNLRVGAACAGAVAIVLTLSADAYAQGTGSGVSLTGVVNAANGSPTVAPGSLATVRLASLKLSPAWPDGAPTATSLAGLALQFQTGAAAPLLFASSTIAVIQIPWEMAGQSQVTLTGTANGQTSAPATVSVAAYAPGIFSVDGSGRGQGVIESGLPRLADARNPATSGSTVVKIYATGLGPVTSPQASGASAPGNPAATTTTMPVVTIGGVTAKVMSSMLLKGEVGVYEVDALVPVDAPTGDAVPLALTIGGVASNTVTLAIRTPDQQADRLVAQMTTAEKLQLTHGALQIWNAGPLGEGGFVPGIPRLGIPDLHLADGSVGVGNGVGPSTALPSSIASAASWDLDQAYKYGAVIGAEMRAHGLNVNLGGNVNLIGREPRNGRTFETKGEDPVLAGRITAAHLRAIQDRHVIAGIKHFALNDQESGRTTANVAISERGMRESDLLAFEIGIKDSNVQSVMCSYNLLNGQWACGNNHLLNEILKGDWGFSGFVMSDWYATHNPAADAMAGLDQEQPGDHPIGDSSQVYYWPEDLAAAVRNGTLTMDRLNDMARRIVRAMFAVGLIDHPVSVGKVDAAAGAAVAQEAEEQGAVLLKNANGLLPLNPASSNSIAVIGLHADVGVLSGAGSAQVWPVGGYALRFDPLNPPGWGQILWDSSSPLRAIQAIAPNAQVTFNDGANAASAASAAKKASTAIVFVSTWTSEGMDLASLNLERNDAVTPMSQDTLVSAVAAANPNTIVVVQSGGAQLMPWLGSVGAVLEAWYPGQRGAEAIANLLFGRVNPSGKLPVTFPASVAQLPRPSIPQPPDWTTPFTVDCNIEGFNVGYKWYDVRGQAPFFPFGFGLSYTTFSITGARVADNLAASGSFQVTFNVTNTGPLAGAEVAQVYLGLPASTGEPPKRLVGWQKVFLQPGQQEQIAVQVNSDDSSHPMSYWNETSGGWVTAAGDYPVYVGNSSATASLALAGTLHVSQ